VNPESIQDLEFGAILERLAAETVTPAGASLALAVRPVTDAESVRSEQGLTLEAVRHLDERGTLPFGTLPDPEPLFERLAVEGQDCSPLEVLDLVGLLRAGRDVKGALALHRAAYPRLWEVARDLPDLGNLIRFLDGKIGPHGEILDHASDDLTAIRQEIRRAGARLEELLARIVERPEIARALQDDYVALRSERHVLPIRAESRQAVSGIVHAVSGTGATVFVEPLETVEINNEVVTLREAEAAEIRRLLREYTDLLRSRLPELRTLSSGIARLDLVMARGRVGRHMDARPASITDAETLTLRGARHPLLEHSLRGGGGAIVPLDLEVVAGQKVLVVSGPNTGGKTVALKTVGLLALMHQAGLLVPAREACLPLFRSVFIDIGDRQSIRDHLSTFSARMRSIAGIARGLELPALLLLDEVGTGTDPEEGTALGIAIVDYFRRRGARIIATTHLDALKAYAASSPDCANAAMQFDERTGEPTYRLVHGVPGRSSALEIAEHLGLPGAILDDARARRGTGARLIDTYVRRLQELSTELEGRVRDCVRREEALRDREVRAVSDLRDREAAQRQSVAAEIDRAVAAVREEGARYLATLQDRELALRLRREEEKQAGRLKAEARRRLREVAPHAVSDTSGAITAGDRVRVRGLDTPASVQEVQGDRAILLVRGKRLVVPLLDVEPVTGAGIDPGRRTLPPGVTLTRRAAATSTDLDIRGLLVEEALERLDKFLDDASVDGIDRVRLVHGLGSGRLRKAVRDFLARHPLVAGVASADPREGGEGVTFVTLRG
jgi:DNA mismatch repair protein MutS2